MREIIYTFRIIWWPNSKLKDRKAVLKMILLNDLSNSFGSIDIVGVVEILYFYVNIVLTKQ